MAASAFKLTTMRLAAPTAIALALSGCAALSSAAGPPLAQPLAPRTRTSGCQVRGALPDAACTPGSILTADGRIVCVRGYARSVRDVAYSEKRAVYRSYGIGFHRPRTYEVDHLVPLELGGANDPANLWPEAARPKPGYHEKDRLENFLHDLVCSGRLALRAAQREIARDWVRAWIAAGRP
jgi:hypothetical protein